MLSAVEDPSRLEDAVVALDCRGNFMFDPANHRDFLGAILGTGVVRDRVGVSGVGWGVTGWGDEWLWRGGGQVGSQHNGVGTLEEKQLVGWLAQHPQQRTRSYDCPTREQP